MTTQLFAAVLTLVVGAAAVKFNKLETVHLDSKAKFIRRSHSSSEVQKAATRLRSWQESLREDPALFKGCSKIFLDVGSNRGTHVRKLFEPDKYPGCPYSSKFDEGFGVDRNRPSSETGICAFGFEANPRWTSRLQQIEETYKDNGWRAKWFAPSAVGNTTKDIEFWLNDKPGSGDSDWGFSEVKLHDYSTSVKVHQFDLSEFMDTLNKYASPGYRLMKMDIESAEFNTLPKFLDRNLFCKDVLNKLTIEWHVQWLPPEKQEWGKNMMDKINSPTKCGTRPSTDVEAFDDESFLNDGMPLPGEKETASYQLYHAGLVLAAPVRRALALIGVFPVF